MAKNDNIEEHKKHIKHNAIEGDLATIMLDVIKEISNLRRDLDALQAKVP